MRGASRPGSIYSSVNNNLLSLPHNCYSNCGHWSFEWLDKLSAFFFLQKMRFHSFVHSPKPISLFPRPLLLAITWVLQIHRFLIYSSTVVTSQSNPRVSRLIQIYRKAFVAYCRLFSKTLLNLSHHLWKKVIGIIEKFQRCSTKATFRNSFRELFCLNYD